MILTKIPHVSQVFCYLLWIRWENHWENDRKIMDTMEKSLGIMPLI